MQIKIDRVQQENAIALSMLNHLMNDEQTRLIIQKFGSGLAENILQPLIYAVQTTELNDLPKGTKATIDYLVQHHSSKARQYDGLEMSIPEEQLNTRNGILALLFQMKVLLKDLSQCTSMQSLTNYFKSMYDLTSSFIVEHTPNADATFKELNSIVMPTASEAQSRISYTEVGDKKKQFAKTFGLFATSRDLIDERAVSKMTSVADARITGKSLFAAISTPQRYRLVFNDYHQAKKSYDTLQAQLASADELTRAKELLKIHEEKMTNLRIPLHLKADQLDELDKIATRNTTWIEKIAAQHQAPLVCSVSGNTARLLIALIHFKMIRATQASLDELQILANCVAAHMVFQGHHSFEEVHEASRRAIDALFLLESFKESEPLPVSHDFYKVGRCGFLHPSYAKKVTDYSQTYLTLASEMPQHYSRNKDRLSKDFESLLKLIKDKANDLKTRKRAGAYHAAATLYNELRELEIQFSFGKIPYDDFQNHSIVAIDRARIELKKHRGWKEILGNITLCILGLGIGYLAVCAYKGSFFGFKTDSESRLDGLQSSIKGMSTAG